MSSKGWSAACTGVQARASAQKSPDFTPTRRDSGIALPGKGRPARAARAGAVCVVANPRNSWAIAAVWRGWAPPPSIPSRKDTVAARGDFEQVLRVTILEAKLGGNHHLVAHRRQRFANHLFVQGPIGLGRVEKGDALRGGIADQLHACAAANPGAIAKAQAHAAQAEGGDLQAAAAEWAGGDGGVGSRVHAYQRRYVAP